MVNVVISISAMKTIQINNISEATQCRLCYIQILFKKITALFLKCGYFLFEILRINKHLVPT